ncbi:MAG: hypothetical protein E7665_06925 [Ruminococcaceae bacterium]|nr:hypothetical protein [Oscillospiraceae bacterium]
MKKVISIVLSLLMLCAVVSCGDEQPHVSTGGSAQTTGSATGTVETTEEVPYLPDSYPELEGMEFNILTRDAGDVYWEVYDLTAEELKEEPINDAVFERNAYLEAKYGFKIKETATTNSYSDTITAIENVNKSGTETYHAVAINAMYTAGSLATSNNLIDLKTVSTLDLEQSFWNQRFIDNMTVGGKLFTLTGDLTVTYHDVAWIQLFNKELLEDKGIDTAIGNPYTLVNEGKWTLDVMHRMGAMAAEDLNGDGFRTETDRFGYVFAGFNNYALYYAGGNAVIGKDENDLPVLTVYSTRAVETVEKIKEMLKDTNVNRMDNSEPNKAIFNNGRALFMNAQMIGVRVDQRGVEFDFGILPTPKIDESQEEYSNVVSMSATVYAIPTSCQHVEETGFVLNALAYQSQFTLLPAYFDTTFEIITRDPESEETLRNILDASYFDLSFMYDTGWLYPLMNDMADMDLSSKYDSMKNTSQAVIDGIIEGLNKTE